MEPVAIWQMMQSNICAGGAFFNLFWAMNSLNIKVLPKGKLPEDDLKVKPALVQENLFQLLQWTLLQFVK